MTRFFYLAFAACAATSAFAAPPKDVAQRIQHFERGLLPAVLVAGEAPKLKALNDRMAELKVPGVSVAVIHQGRIDWARGYGVTQLNGAAVSEKSLFQAASISKPVFAMAVLHLVDEGKLKLDTNVNDYLKSWKVPDNQFTATEKVTMRRLLSHSAGLTVHGFAGYAGNEKVPTILQVLDGTPPANSGPVRVDIPPGSQFRYSGGGFTVAQLVLTDVTGVSLPQYMQDTVLKPLGMTLSTYEQPLPQGRWAEVAMPYRGDGNPVGAPHTYPEMAAAGLWTTPSDLARYALGVRDALAGKSKVISSATARNMLAPVIDQQGIGLHVGGSTPRKFFLHGGSNAGYQCFLVAYEDGAGVVVMTNSDSGWQLVGEVMRTIASIYEWPDFGPPTRKIAAVKPEQLERLIGAYRLDERSVYVVRKKGDTLVGHFVGNEPVPVFPSSDLELFSREVNQLATFTLGEDGKVSSISQISDGWQRTGTRLGDDETRKVMDGLARADQRVKDQKADPRSESTLRETISDLAKGAPNYEKMSAEFANVIRRQQAGLQQQFSGLGPLKALEFRRVTENAADEFDADFEHGALKIWLLLDEAGRIEGAWMEPR
jgi:CubicO group peptidase (beta-lactamase class C family)